ncbi:MAG TPA: GPW/gp25 family protein [Chitinophagales bacterium]|nr:GPW/gp25 family protein [Chitinophagales bacterium]
MPIPFEAILDRRDFYKTDLRNSIHQRIHLVLVTFLGESRYDPDFGCSIWDFDFENISNVNAWKDRVTKSIIDSLGVHEKRIDRIRVSVDIKPEGIRKRLEVKVEARIVKTNEQLPPFVEPIYISPISLD